MKKALITGISGQDGSYLAELLLAKNYKVEGTTTGEGNEASNRIGHLTDKIVSHVCDVRDRSKLFRLIEEQMPDEVYHLASLVEPRVLFEKEAEIFEVNFSSTHHLLQAIKTHVPKAKFFLASSSMVFGNPQTAPQNENTPLRPTTPYGIAKAASQQMVQMYREIHGVYACSGILYNHESPRRDFHFLPRKITFGAAQIKAGVLRELMLGDLDTRRDWGFAGDYVEAMWLMLQDSVPEDYVLGTGETHSIRELLEIAFGYFDLDWRQYVKSDPQLFRKGDVTINLVPDISKIKNRLHWAPKHSFKQLIELMAQEDAKIVGVGIK